MPPPRQPRAFARLARWQYTHWTEMKKKKSLNFGPILVHLTFNQEPITRSLQLPHVPVMAFSQIKPIYF